MMCKKTPRERFEALKEEWNGRTFTKKDPMEYFDIELKFLLVEALIDILENMPFTGE